MSRRVAVLNPCLQKINGHNPKTNGHNMLCPYSRREKVATWRVRRTLDLSRQVFSIPGLSIPDMLKVAALWLLFGSLPAVGQKAKPEPENGVIHSQKLPFGVPLGGIGAGSVQVLTDGTFSHAVLTNNWSHPIQDLPGCFAAIWTKVGETTRAQVLALKSPYSLPTAPALDYEGLYPQANLTFPNPALPLSVSLRAFSPILPFDLRNSSFPAVHFLFRLRNTATKPIEVSVALSWENILGVGGTPTLGNFANQEGCEVVPMPDAEGYFGLKYTGPPPNLDSVGEERQRNNATGNMSLMTYPPRKEATVTLAGWNVLDSRPAWWDSFAQNGSVSGTAPIGAIGKATPAGVIAVRMTIKPRDFLEIPFAVAWYTPRYYTPEGRDVGHYYQNLFMNSQEVAHTLLADWRSLFSLTEDWQKQLYFSTLPPAQIRRTIQAAAVLSTQTFHTRDEHFTFLSPINANPPNSSPLLAQLPASTLLLAFFPSLHAQELTRFTTTHPANQKPNNLNSQEVSAFGLQAAQYVLWTGDQEALSLYYPALRTALRSLLTASTKDGRRVSGVGDRKFIYAPLTVWVAGLRAAQVLAIKQGDTEFAKECVQALVQVTPEKEATVWQEFWGGKPANEEIPFLFRSLANVNPTLLPDPASMELASEWNALYGLQGFQLDREAGNLTLRIPNPGKGKRFMAPLFSPTFWAQVEFKPLEPGSVLILRFERFLAITAATPSRRLSGSAGLTLKTLRLSAPSSPSLPNVQVSLGPNPIGSRVLRETSGDLLITFETPITLATGDRLEVHVH